MNVLQYYEKTLAERGYRADEAQQRAIARLQVFADELVAYQQELGKPFRRFFRKPEPPRGVYMWGGVGRGKSFLMDSFFMT
ncbi:MAG TPA: AFG1/ZapE family ATPase, partial [Advenella sp.]|nr:AFG1/ZapE family ATPase [Advenella sp.]